MLSFAVTAGATALADVMPSATQTQKATYKQANESHLVNNHITENQAAINQAAAKEKLAKKAAEAAAQAAAEQAAAEQAAADQAAAEQAAAAQAAADQAAAEQAAAAQAAADQAAAEQAAAAQAAADQAAAAQAAAAQAAADQAAAAQAAAVPVAVVPDMSSNYFFYQVVQAEAGPSYQEKLNVASVIMNRVASGAWGGTTIDAVVNAPGQFEAVWIGAAAAQVPSAETIQAVNEVLNGTRTTTAQSFRASGDGVTNVFF